MPTTIEGTLSAEGLAFSVVVSRFNGLVTRALLDGALDCLRRHGAAEQDITVIHCPGAFEIPQVTLRVISTTKPDAVICLGCVIQGETPHFDFVAGEVSRGIGQISLQTGTPVAFGVLTTGTLEQALERAGAKAGNKGWDAALTAIELAQLTRTLPGGKTRPNT